APHGIPVAPRLPVSRQRRIRPLGSTTRRGPCCARTVPRDGPAAPRLSRWLSGMPGCRRFLMAWRSFEELLILLDHAAERDPYRPGKEAEAAEHQERRRKSDPFRDPAAELGTERGARALNGDDRALREIDAAGAVKRTRDHAGHRHALQADA